MYSAMVALANDKDALVSSVAADQQILMSSPSFIEKMTSEKRLEEDAKRVQQEEKLEAFEATSREEAKQRFVEVLTDKVRRDTKKKLSMQFGSKRASPRRPTIGGTGKTVRGSFSFSESRTDTPPRTRPDRKK